MSLSFSTQNFVQKKTRPEPSHYGVCIPFCWIASPHKPSSVTRQIAENKHIIFNHSSALAQDTTSVLSGHWSRDSAHDFQSKRKRALPRSPNLPFPLTLQMKPASLCITLGLPQYYIKMDSRLHYTSRHIFAFKRS